MANESPLSKYLDLYLDALEANDPSKLPLTANARYTENGQELPLGKGIWATATPFARGFHYIEVCDDIKSNAVLFAAVKEGDKQSVIGTRLKVDGDRVSEIETLVCRDPGETGVPRVFSPDNMKQVNPAFREIIPQNERTSREDQVRIGNLYFDGILQSKGSIIPVTDDCVRVENGTQTVLTGNWRGDIGKMSVSAQMDTGIFRDIEAVRERRAVAFDEARGLSVIIFMFDHPGPVTGAPFESRFAAPNSMEVWEIFKISNGTITRIESVLNVFPYGMKSGWD